ncbi:MAG: hypothetical protein DWQ07_17250 [Chloroflexi bacterium]|nr:MAG: hypothetical protein DWQ07_17250 [Chloroflexota bacterium]MBL1195153.1 hypothetical protein [Chloroflexota bacterium]NOH12438.1 hypothetical protein [Chloroflexota bacterium]
MNMDRPDWLENLKALGVNAKHFENAEKALTRNFGSPPSINDIVWRILNEMAVGKSDKFSRELAYWKMAWLAAQEGKDFRPYFKEAGNFLTQEMLVDIRSLENRDTAVNILKTAEQSPAVIDELRKEYTNRAREARKNKDWQKVYNDLQGYLDYAEGHRAETIKLVNAPPPDLTNTAKRWLAEARERLGKE